MMGNTSFRLNATALVALVLGRSAIGQSLPDCTIDFEENCPDFAPVCGASFSGGDGCLFEGLEFCYSSGFFAYKVTPAAPLTITLSGDLTSLDLFFAHQGVGASGTMHFFDAEVGGNEVGIPLATNGDCDVVMPPMHLLSFPTPVRRIEVTASGGRFDALWIDDFHVNPVPPCSADLDSSGDVGILDLLALLAAWGPNPGHPADFDGDGTVGILDLLTLLANWGPCA